MLTILQCLYDFWIARHALNRPIKWRNEKFILGKLAETANIIHLQVGFGYENCVVFLRTTMQLTISDKKTLWERKVMPKKDLCEFLPIQLNYSSELPQYNLRYCSIINAIRVVLPLSWLLGHLSIPESRKREHKFHKWVIWLKGSGRKKNFKWHNFNFYSFFSSYFTHTRKKFWSWCCWRYRGEAWNWMMGLLWGLCNFKLDFGSIT